MDIKINAPHLLRYQLPRVKRGTIWIASVCDPYQPVEAKYELTRKCLSEISRFQFPVFIQTKSDMVLRDLDLLSQIQDLEIGFSIATEDDCVARIFEPGAPSISRRLMALEKIKKQGLKTFVFIGPILPQNPERLIKEISGLADRVFIDRLNYTFQFLSFYREHNFESYARDEFFLQTKRLLVEELEKQRLNYELIF